MKVWEKIMSESHESFPSCSHLFASLLSQLQSSGWEDQWNFINGLWFCEVTIRSLSPMVLDLLASTPLLNVIQIDQWNFTIHTAYKRLHVTQGTYYFDIFASITKLKLLE